MTNFNRSVGFISLNFEQYRSLCRSLHKIHFSSGRLPSTFEVKLEAFGFGLGVDVVEVTVKLPYTGSFASSASRLINVTNASKSG